MPKPKQAAVGGFVDAVDAYLKACADLGIAHRMQVTNVRAEANQALGERHIAAFHAVTAALAELVRRGEFAAKSNAGIAVPVRETVYRAQSEATETSAAEFKSWWTSTKAILVSAVDTPPPPANGTSSKNAREPAKLGRPAPTAVEIERDDEIARHWNKHRDMTKLRMDLSVEEVDARKALERVRYRKRKPKSPSAKRSNSKRLKRQ